MGTSGEGDPALRFLTENKMYIIAGVVGALLLLAIIQMAVTIHRNKMQRPPPVSTKVCSVHDYVTAL